MPRKASVSAADRLVPIEEPQTTKSISQLLAVFVALVSFLAFSASRPSSSVLGFSISRVFSSPDAARTDDLFVWALSTGLVEVLELERGYNTVTLFDGTTVRR